MAGDAMNINDEGRSNAAYWHKRATEAEARLQKIMARCADLLDEDCHDIAVRDERLAEAETALRIIAEQDWRYDELKARLAALELAAWEAHEAIYCELEEPDQNSAAIISDAIAKLGELLPVQRPSVSAPAVCPHGIRLPHECKQCADSVPQSVADAWLEREKTSDSASGGAK